MLQVLEDLSTSLVNLVRSLCLMVYNSSRSTRVNQTKKCSNTGYNTQTPLAQGLRKRGRIRRWNRQTHDDGFEAYFQKVFDNTEYEAKDEDELKFNEAKIPKMHHQERHTRAAKKESKVSMKQIKVQLQQKSGRKIHRSTSQILGIERRDKIPKGILRRAKKRRQELNPELLVTENPRPLRLTRSSACLLTQSHAAGETKNVTSSLKRGIGTKITRNTEKPNKEVLKEINYDMQRTRSGRLVKKRFKLCL